MNISWTLSYYLGRQFLLVVLLTFAVFLTLIFTFELVELLRRGADKPGVTFGLLASMALMELPRVGGKTLPFAFLFGGMAAFLRLSRNNELVVARAAGVSVWQFIAPALVVSFVIGSFVVTVQPSFRHTGRTIPAVRSEIYRSANKFPCPVVERTVVAPSRLDRPIGRPCVAHERTGRRALRRHDISHGNATTFLGRIDAREAVLGDGHWALEDVWVLLTNDQPRHYDTYQQETSLTAEQVQESFARPDTISFWDLPNFIQTAEAAGFSARRYQLHFHQILATPALLCTMVLVAAAFSMRTARAGGIIQVVLGGIFSGFLVYFLSDLSLALGLSGILPTLLAAWAPSIVVMLLGLAVLFHLEDG